MEYPYILVIAIPLIVYLVFIIWYELKTSLILDKVVMPAAIVFSIIPVFFKNSHLLLHIAGMISLLFYFLVAASAYNKLAGKEGIGGGAIKLMCSIGAAVGLLYSLQVAIIFTLLIVFGVIIAKWIFGIESLPSSPFALIAVFVTIIFHKFLSWQQIFG